LRYSLLATLGAFVRPDLDQASGLLGRYYEGLHPEKFPPIIVRVDTKINFNSITDLGSLPSPSCVLWRGQIYAPKPGSIVFSYRLMIPMMWSSSLSTGTP